MQRLHSVGGDDRRQKLIPDTKPDLGQKTVHTDFFDDAEETIPRAQTRERVVRPVRTDLRGAPGRRGKQPIDFNVGDAVMTATGQGRSDLAKMHPAFQRGVRDAQPVGGGANGDESHGPIVVGSQFLRVPMSSAIITRRSRT